MELELGTHERIDWSRKIIGISDDQAPYTRLGLLGCLGFATSARDDILGDIPRPTQP